MLPQNKGCHLIPYKGRHASEAYEQNLLWADGSVYVMDNHRAAAWCWTRHLRPKEKFSVLHIDQHYDLLTSRIEEWCKITPRIEKLSIESYLSLEYKLEGTLISPVIRWDNYFSIFVEQRRRMLQTAYFLTHCIGDKPSFKFHEKQFWLANYNLACWLAYNAPWLVNVDMDYFFSKQGDGHTIQLFSDDYIEQVGSQVKEANDAGNVRCITLAISPEICGGWDRGLHALRVFCRGLGLSLPEL